MLNRALRTLFIYNGIFVFAWGLLGPLYAVFVQEITSNVVMITFSWALFLFASTSGTFFLSRVGDKVKEKEYLLIAGYILRAFVWIAYIFVDTVAVLLLLQILFGIGDALGTPAFNALMAEHLDKGRHIEEYSDMMILFNLCTGLAAVVGGIIVQQYGFNTLFLIMGGLTLISIFGLYNKPRRLL